MWPTRSDLDDDLVQEMEDFLVEHGNRYLNATVIEGIPMSSLFQVGFKLSHCCYVHLRGMVHGSLCQGSTALICGRVCVELLVVLRDPLGDSHYHWIEFGFESHTALQDLSGSLDRTGRGFLLARSRRVLFPALVSGTQPMTLPKISRCFHRVNCR